MKTIHILGTGCPKCRQLAENTAAAVAESGSDFEIIKVTDINEIMTFGVMLTPALAVEGKVKASGKVLSIEEIKTFLKGT